MYCSQRTSILSCISSCLSFKIDRILVVIASDAKQSHTKCHSSPSTCHSERSEESLRQRFEMMLKRSKEIKELLEKSGRRKPFEIIKRIEGSGRQEEIEKFIFQSFKKLSYQRRRVSRY